LYGEQLLKNLDWQQLAYHPEQIEHIDHLEVLAMFKQE